MNNMVAFLPLLIVMGAFMFFASRRQRRAMEATIALHDSLRVGDRVHTTSGLQGTIAAIAEDDVDLLGAMGSRVMFASNLDAARRICDRRMVTLATETRAGSGGKLSGSIRTAPVNHSSGPLIDGCEPARLSSIGLSSW